MNRAKMLDLWECAPRKYFCLFSLTTRLHNNTISIICCVQLCGRESSAFGRRWCASMKNDDNDMDDSLRLLKHSENSLGTRRTPDQAAMNCNLFIVYGG